MLKRLVLALVLLTGAAFVAPTAVLAEDCPIQEGQIVESSLDGKHYVILSLTPNSGCLVEYRSVDPYTGPFDPYISGMLGDFLVPYNGPVANTKRYGCPWEEGDTVDVNTVNGWRAAIITGSDKTCTYTADYYEDDVANAVKISPNDANDVIRSATLQIPSQDRIDIAKVCPPGGKQEDFADDSVDSTFKRAIIVDSAKRFREPISVYFDKITYGQIKHIDPGGPLEILYRDAMVDTDLYPFRLALRVCVDSSGRPNTVSFVQDFDCYTDQFGEFVCRLNRN